MVKGVIICDLDNTLFDCQSALERRYPNYNLLNQTDYSYKNKIKGVSESEVLSNYGDIGFYGKMTINQEVADFLRTSIAQGYDVVFLSMSVSEVIHNIKRDVLANEGFWNCPFYRDGVDFEVFGSNGQVANDLKSLIEVYRSLGIEVLVVDDAPKRLTVCKLLGVRYCLVEHPYNYKLFARSELLVYRLKPNYYKKYRLRNSLRCALRLSCLWKG